MRVDSDGLSAPGVEAEPEVLPTIWRVPDELWTVVEAILAERDPPKRTGRKRIDQRNALDGVIFRARTGCQWNHLPREFGDDSSVHRTQQRWIARGVWQQLWQVLLCSCAELGGVDFEWQAADGMLGKARGVPKRGPRSRRSAPTPRTEARRAPRRACA